MEHTVKLKSTDRNDADRVQDGMDTPQNGHIQAQEEHTDTTIGTEAEPNAEQDSSLRDFFAEKGNLDDEVESILISPDLLKEEQLLDLHAILQHYLPEEVAYGADFDFTQEITSQLTAIRALRLKVMNPNGTLKNEVSTREAKEVITASSTLLTQIMKHHEKIQNFERQRAIEEATTVAIKTLPEETQRQFFGTLKEMLDRLQNG